MFRRKKTSLPSAPAEPADREASVRPKIAVPEIALVDEPRITPFLGREPRLEAVRSPEQASPDSGSIPDRPQQEIRPPMVDKPNSPPPEKAGPVAKPQSPSGPPSPPSRNPLSHLPHIGDPARRPNYPGIPGMERSDRPRPVVEGRKLIVGRDIELTGSIQACDTLVVEGRVESDITDASVIEVAANGMFHGSAEVDHAEIAGTFEGTLTVNKKLSLARTGRIIGTVRYATLEVEAGGQIQGSMEVLGQNAAPPARAD